MLTAVVLVGFLTMLFELLLLIRSQQRNDLVLGAHAQHGQLAFGLGRCLSEIFRFALVVLFRFIQIVQSFVSLTQSFCLLVHRGLSRIDDGKHFVLLLIREVQPGQKRWRCAESGPHTRAGTWTQSHVRAHARTHFATRPGRSRERSAEDMGLGPAARAVGITLGRGKAGEGVCQEKAGRQKARPYQGTRTFHLWTPYAFLRVRGPLSTVPAQEDS